jgi:NADH dehydrogenase
MSTRQAPAGSARPRVVIVGGGFGGFSAARALRRAPVDLTLIDRTNHYLFQPLLYQVATGVLSPADIAMPLRVLLRTQSNAMVLLAEVNAIDLANRLVTADGGRLQVPFDYLVVATGSRHSYFNHPEWEPMAPGLKTLDDAREIRRRFLMALEQAEKSADPAGQEGLLTFVIIGGGPTGVELAGMLPTLARKGFRRDFRRLDPAKVRIVLLEGGPRLLPAFPESLSARAYRDLEELGVQCRTGAIVTRVTVDAVYVGEERIAARTVFWAAGNVASPLVKVMGVESDRTGRAVVLPDLSVADHPHVFIVGDAAAVPGVPGLAAAANQMGEHAARMIERTLKGQPREPFRYRDKGSLAVIGRSRAIADFGRVKFTGALAFYTWLFVHLLYLAGFRNRLSVLLEWGYAYFTYRPSARLITRDDAQAVAPVQDCDRVANGAGLVNDRAP